MAMSVKAIAQPAGARVSMVAIASTTVDATSRRRRSRHTVTRPASVATLSAALHMYTSW